jgi:chaperonin GroES
MSMKLVPTNDRLVVRPLSEEESTSGGLIIPDTAREKPLEGVVLSVGPGRYNEMTGIRVPVDISEGAHVLYSKYAGTEFRLNDEPVLLIQEEDVLARITNEDKFPS